MWLWLCSLVLRLATTHVQLLVCKQAPRSEAPTPDPHALCLPEPTLTLHTACRTPCSFPKPAGQRPWKPAQPSSQHCVPALALAPTQSPEREREPLGILPSKISTLLKSPMSQLTLVHKSHKLSLRTLSALISSVQSLSSSPAQPPKRFPTAFECLPCLSPGHLPVMVSSFHPHNHSLTLFPGWPCHLYLTFSLIAYFLWLPGAPLLWL